MALSGIRDGYAVGNTSYELCRTRARVVFVAGTTLPPGRRPNPSTLKLSIGLMNFPDGFPIAANFARNRGPTRVDDGHGSGT